MCRWYPPLVSKAVPLFSVSYSMVILSPLMVALVRHTQRVLLLMASVHCSSAGSSGAAVGAVVGGVAGPEVAFPGVFWAAVVGPVVLLLLLPVGQNAMATPPAPRIATAAAAATRRPRRLPDEPPGGVP